MTTTPRKNNAPAKSLKLIEVARLVGGELVGDGRLEITGVAGIKEAEKGDITFLSNDKYLPFLRETKASAVITSPEVRDAAKPLVRTENPSAAFTKVVSYFMPAEEHAAPGVHATAVVGPGVRLGRGVSVGPHVVIEKDARIGEGSVIGAGCFVGHGARIGAHCRLYPNVTLREDVESGDRVIIHSGTVIGSDGFGYETTGGKHVKIPHTGSVTLEDDVEIGANVCVDRGRFRNTLIGRGTKIDNLVQVAHNVIIGPDCLVVSQAGISGSTELGKNVIVAGQAGLVGHLTVGDGAVIGARAGVSKSVPAKTVVLGEPARPIQEQKRLFALIARLPEMFKELSELKKKLK